MPYDDAPSIRSVDDLLERVDELRSINEAHVAARNVIRAVMNGGAEAVKYLIGDSEMDYLPSANLTYSGIERIAQKLTRPPSVRVDSPPTNDSARARNRAEKRERIVEGYDRASNLRMQMPQAARWLPGYGFVPWVIRSAMTEDGQPFPSRELRDPFGCLPGPWTVHQQPADIAFVRAIPYSRLRRIYPALPPAQPRNSRRAWSGGGVLLGHTSEWEAQGDEDIVRTIEYRNHEGTFMLLEEGRQLLDFEPNPPGVGCSFVVAKRFAFDRLQGQFEHALGLQQMLARMNVLAFLSIQDSVFSETNVLGNMTSDEYRRGRGAVNLFEPGTRVERPNDPSNFQQFQQTDRLERQLRLTGAYPVTDDAQSPNSFVTGQGLRELTSASDNVVNEYQTVFIDALERGDSKMLRWDDEMWPDLSRELPGQHRGASYVETYTPSRHIKRDYATRRVYGVLSGLDSSAQLIGLLQISQAGWLDDISAMENIDGIDNVQQVRERMDRQKAEGLLEQAMLSAVQGGPPMDPRILRVLVDGLEPGPRKQRFEEVFFPPPEEGQPVDPATGAAVEPEPLAAPGEDPTTIMSRLFSTGGSTAAAQTVQTA